MGRRPSGPGPVSPLPPLAGQADLTEDTLHASLSDAALESMNFLNEIGMRYPDAISFASGRPTEDFFGSRTRVVMAASSQDPGSGIL